VGHPAGGRPGVRAFADSKPRGSGAWLAPVQPIRSTGGWPATRASPGRSARVTGRCRRTSTRWPATGSCWNGSRSRGPAPTGRRGCPERRRSRSTSPDDAAAGDGQRSGTVSMRDPWVNLFVRIGDTRAWPAICFRVRENCSGPAASVEPQVRGVIAAWLDAVRGRCARAGTALWRLAPGHSGDDGVMTGGTRQTGRRAVRSSGGAVR
jgi:hypothetical protein